MIPIPVDLTAMWPKVAQDMTSITLLNRCRWKAQILRFVNV